MSQLTEPAKRRKLGKSRRRRYVAEARIARKVASALDGATPDMSGDLNDLARITELENRLRKPE
jgi:hypothetical protein